MENQISTIDAKALDQWLKDEKAILIDVRERGEHASERIPNSTLIPLSKFDPDQMPSANGRKVVLYCRVGHRSKSAAQKVIQAKSTTIYHLKGGLNAWKSFGYETERSCKAPLDIIRQVHITAGSLIVSGVALGKFVSPWFFGLSAFVGCGLFFSGATGICGMAILLSKLPYNQRFDDQKVCE